MKSLFNRHYFGIILIFISFIGMIATFQPVTAQDDGLVRVRVIPEDAQVAMGEVLDVAVEVRNATDLYAIDLLLEFDPSAVAVIDMNEDLEGIQVQLGTLLEPGFVMINLADNSIGRLRLAMTQLNPATPKNGSGTLIVVRFRPLAVTPSSAITILKADLATPYGTKLEVEEIKNGTVEVLQTIVGPTATDIPAQDPGTPMPTQVPPTAAPSATGTLVIQPTATATMNYLVLLPTSTITPTPWPTQTATQTLQPSATMLNSDPTATDEVNLAIGVQPTAEEKPQVVLTAEATENEEVKGSWWLWVIIPVVVLAVVAGVVIILRKKSDRKPMEY